MGLTLMNVFLAIHISVCNKDNRFTFPDRPGRNLAEIRNIRWARKCTETGGRCLMNFQCCSKGDFCMIEDTTKYGFGFCKPTYNMLDAYLPDSKFGYKKKNQECIDSVECADQCCRVTRMGRYGKKLTCGKPEENTACIGRVFSKNDYNGY